MYIVFLIRWYVSRCFFHSLDNFHGRKPPCCVGLFLRIDVGVALQVFSSDTDFFPTILSNAIHASCH